MWTKSAEIFNPYEEIGRYKPILSKRERFIKWIKSIFRR